MSSLIVSSLIVDVNRISVQPWDHFERTLAIFVTKVHDHSISLSFMIIEPRSHGPLNNECFPVEIPT
jgi:hypothetical protein